jgi:hypothetical protein
LVAWPISCSDSFGAYSIYRVGIDSRLLPLQDIHHLVRFGLRRKLLGTLVCLPKAGLEAVPFQEVNPLLCLARVVAIGRGHIEAGGFRGRVQLIGVDSLFYYVPWTQNNAVMPPCAVRGDPADYAPPDEIVGRVGRPQALRAAEKDQCGQDSNEATKHPRHEDFPAAKSRQAKTAASMGPS